MVWLEHLSLCFGVGILVIIERGVIMEINSAIQLSKYIEVEEVDEFNNNFEKQVGFMSANINKQEQQCVINVQIFEKEKIEDYKTDIQEQVEEFFLHLGACVRHTNLEVLNTVLPSNEEINEKVAKLSL
mgnify:CR=1 FL=1